MRKLGHWSGVIVWGGIFLLGVAGSAAAGERKPSYVDGAFRKLGRGIANIVTCPLELIRTPELVGRRDGYVASLSVGLTQGVWRVIARGVSGAYEVVTFPIPLPRHFHPVITPEFVWAHGDWSEQEKR